MWSSFNRSFRAVIRPRRTERTATELEKIACEYATIAQDTNRAAGYRQWAQTQAERYAMEARFLRMGIAL